MKKQLKDVCEGFTKNIAQKDLSENNGKYPIFGASGIIKSIDFYISDNPYIGIVKDGSGVGRTNKYPAKSSLLGTMQYIIPKQGIDLDYLMYGIRSLHLGENYSGAAIPHIYFKVYKNRTLDFPELAEQRQRSIVLNKIQDAINVKEKQLFELEKIIQSEFVEMFGNPVNNDKSFPKKRMTEVCPIQESKIQLDSDSVWLLNLDMIEQNTGTILEKQIVSMDALGNSTIQFSSEHVLYSKLRPYLNKVALPDEAGYATSELVPFLPKKEINKIYFAYLLRSENFVDLINSKSCGTKMPRASMDFIRKFEIPVPPIDLQEKFADFVQQIDKSKFVVKQQISDLQELLDSKMQEYFS